MKPAIIVLSILVVATGYSAYDNQQQTQKAKEHAERLSKRIVSLQERMEVLEQKPEPVTNISWENTADTTEATATAIPEEVVAAIAYRLSQDSNALGAIARGVSSNSKPDSGSELNPQQFDQQVRDTLAAVRDEERAERDQRNQERMVERAQERANRMAEQLGLSGNQAEDFTSLLTEHSVEMSQLWGEARELDLGRSEMRNFFEQTREEQNEEIQQVLNDDQYAQYLEMPQGNSWGRRGGGGGPGGNNGGGNNGGGNNGGGNNGGGNGGF